MITTDELKVQLAEYHTAVKDLEEALAIDASRKRVQELEHTMSRPGFYDDAVQQVGAGSRHDRRGPGLSGRRRGRHEECFHDGQGRQRLRPAQE